MLVKAEVNASVQLVPRLGSGFTHCPTILSEKAKKGRGRNTLSSIVNAQDV